MAHIVTSNRLNFRSVNEGVDNFIVVHCYEVDTPKVIIEPMRFYRYDIYVKDGMDIDTMRDDYRNTSGMKVRFIEEPALSAAIDDIIESVIDSAVKDNEDQTVAVMSDPNFTFLVSHYMKRAFQSNINQTGFPIDTMDVYKYYKFASLEKLTDHIKAAIGSNMVYPDDPIAFAYASTLFLNG